MAGGITVTHPDTTQYTGNVNRIIIVDGNGVQHEVQQVYWCPDGTEAKLVWPVSSRYVKYIMRLEDTGENNFSFSDIYLNGSLAGSTLTNGRYIQSGPYATWNYLSSSELASLGNGASDVAKYGLIMELTFTTSTATSFGFKTMQYNQGHTHYTVKIYGVDSEDNETLLKTEELNNVGLLDTRTITI